VKVLLDTHVWLWWLLGSERLRPEERRALDRLAGSGSPHLSAMSLWEAQMLHAKGRLSAAMTAAVSPLFPDARSTCWHLAVLSYR
jgi:PIN domain nuclease of toxin-antitoxin system